MRVPLLVDDFLLRAARVYPEKTAIVDGALRLSYRQFAERAHRLASALDALGIRKGDRVCMLSPNSHYFLESFFGASRIGAILVPLNFRLAAEEHRYILDHAGVKVVLVDHEYTGIVDGIRPQLGKVEHWIVAGGSGAPPPGWRDWDAWLAEAPATPPPEV